MSSITIRKASPKDAIEMQKVLKETWINTYVNKDAQITKDDIESIDFLSEEKIQRIKKRIQEEKNRKSFIAEKENTIVGLCSIHQENDIGKLISIYVLPKAQNLGVGGKLMQKVLEEFKDCSAITLELAEYNTNALGFYSHYGFVKTGEKGKFNLPNDKFLPLIEMRLNLVKQ